MNEQFWDEEEGGFFFTGKDHEQLIARTKDPHDNATPSGNAMAVTRPAAAGQADGQAAACGQGGEDAAALSRA